MSKSKLRKFGGEKAADLFSVLAYSEDDQIFLTDDNSIAFGFLCDPLEGTDQKAKDRINVLLNGDWPDDTIMQFNLYGGQDIHKVMNTMSEIRKDKGTEFTEANTKKRKQFFIDGTQEVIEKNSGVKVRNFVLIVTVKIPINDAIPNEKEIARVSDLRGGFKQSLSTVGLRPDPMDANEYVHLMSSMLNWGDGASWRNGRKIRADDDKPLNEQLLDFDTSVSVDAKGLWLGDEEDEEGVRVTNLSVKRFPRIFHFGNAAAYLGDLMMGSRGIRENCLISAAIHFPSPQKAKSSMETKRQWAVNQAYGPMLKFVPALAQKKHGFDVLFQAIDDGDRIVRVNLGMTLFSKDKESATMAVSNARSYWGELGFGIMEDKYFNLPLF